MSSLACIETDRLSARGVGPNETCPRAFRGFGERERERRERARVVLKRANEGEGKGRGKLEVGGRKRGKSLVSN